MGSPPRPVIGIRSAPLWEGSGKSATTWHMLVADDYHLEAGGEQYRFALIAFFIVCAVAGVPPVMEQNFRQRESVTWVGFELPHKSRQLGTSQRRADWFTRWTSEVAGSSTVHMGSFEEGLGRVMFVAGALEYERPFPGPVYKFLALHPRDSVRAVPICVVLPELPRGSDPAEWTSGLLIKDVPRPACTKSGRPGQRRKDRHRRMVSSC